MPGGLLALACYGNENIVINGNPQLSMFYKAFLRHTHFAKETIRIPLEGPSQLTLDSPILVRAKIPRHGDLLSDLVLRFTLPDIFSKAIITEEINPLTAERRYVLERSYEFAWVRMIGARLIDTVTFTIGGQKIQEFGSDWIAARAVLDQDASQYAKWRALVGDVPECFDPAQGIYADPSGGYPNVVAWRGSPEVPYPVQNNAASIPRRIVRVPLGLWFSDYLANALPLVGLAAHECEITLKLRPIRDLYTILDPSGVRVRYGVRSLPYLPSDQYTTVWNPAYFGPLPPTLNNHYGEYEDPQGAPRYFYTDISGAVPLSDGWSMDATLEGTYVFLQESERKVFAAGTLRYNVRQVQSFILPAIQTRETHRIDVHNIATRVVFFGRRTDAIQYRNQATNLTNWMYPQAVNRPVATAVDNRQPNQVYVNDVLTQIGRSGMNVAGLQRNIIRAAFMTANGTPLFDSQDSDYFTQYIPYTNLTGYSAPYMDFTMASQAELWPLYTYSFAKNGSAVEQPTGTLNLSRINRFELDIDVEPIPPFARYTYDLYVFVETLNFLEIASGMGGLKFAI